VDGSLVNTLLPFLFIIKFDIMAENNNERRTFKWGDQEYLLDDLLKEHGAREQEFYDFAKNRGSYDSAALVGLRNAIANRINAAKSGRAF
jgi:hypothetical protein